MKTGGGGCRPGGLWEGNGARVGLLWGPAGFPGLPPKSSPIFKALFAFPEKPKPHLFLHPFPAASLWRWGAAAMGLAGKGGRERSCCPWGQGHKLKA